MSRTTIATVPKGSKRQGRFSPGFSDSSHLLFFGLPKLNSLMAADSAEEGAVTSIAAHSSFFCCERQWRSDVYDSPQGISFTMLRSLDER